MHHLKRSPCTMAAASMHNLAGHGAQFRRKRCAKAAELSPRLLHTLDAEVEHPRRRNWTENDTGSHCPEHWLWGAGTVALTRRTPGSEASEYSFDQFGLEVFQGVKVLEIKKLRFEQTEEILHHSIVQTVAFTAHALPDTFSI